MRDRVAIAARLLNDIHTADYEAIRKKDINAAELAPHSIVKGFLVTRANRSAEERKAEDIKKHFAYHAGHCAECSESLDYGVYPLDKNVKESRGKFGFRWKIVRLPACKKHAQYLKDKVYTLKYCCVCDVLFDSYGTSKYCSSACRSYAYYQMDKKIVKPKTCALCAAEFMPKRTDSIFCSGKCRTASHRAKKTVTDN